MVGYKVVDAKGLAYRVWDKKFSRYDNEVVVNPEGSLIKFDERMSGELIPDNGRYEVHQFSA